jgi:hypothetical protein
MNDRTTNHSNPGGSSRKQLLRSGLVTAVVITMALVTVFSGGALAQPSSGFGGGESGGGGAGASFATTDNGNGAYRPVDNGITNRVGPGNAGTYSTNPGAGQTGGVYCGVANDNCGQDTQLNNGGAVRGDGTIEICNQDSHLTTLINAVVQLAMWGGVISAVVTYMVANFTRTLPIGESQKEQMKRLRKRAVSASIKVVLAGPLAILVFDAAGFQWATECIDLIPWTGQNS